LNSQIADLIQNRTSQEDIDTVFEYITKVQENNKDYMEGLIVTNAVGRVIIDNETKTPDMNLSDRAYIREAVINGKVSISDVLTSKYTGDPTIFVACPVVRNNATIGTIVGCIKLSIISSYVSDIKVGERGYGYLVDKNGLIIEHPDKEKEFKENINESDSENLRTIAQEMNEESEGFYNYNGEYKYVTFKPVEKWVVAVTTEYNDYMSSAIAIKINTLILVIAASIIAIICSYLYSTRCIIKPIKYIEGLMKSAGEGDLTVQAKLKMNDEIGQLCRSFNNMIDNQVKIVKSVLNSSNQLNEASDNMASSSEEISATTQEISATVTNVAEDSKKENESVLHISEVLDQLSSLVQSAQNAAESTNTNAMLSKEAADMGRNKVKQTVQAINNIYTESNETAKVLQQLNELSIQVGGIVNTINEIAERTNLLSLNAAIEAARAGEDGKGFSVVAEEVRKLSEETNSKAKEIEKLVSKMKNQTENAVEAMERANAEVENGVEIVNDTDEAFINIKKSIESIVHHIEKILDVTSEEVESSKSVVSLINEIVATSESNSINCENVSKAVQEESNAINNLSATAEETNAMSQELINLVEKFKI
ncbi:MAG: methyl-accepting chemotaxis protein, partial [Clostridium sp.]